MSTSETTDPSALAGEMPRDAGLTFIELLVTIMLMGTLVLALMTAVQASLRASSKNKEAAAIETMIVNVVDRINRADPKDPRWACDYSALAQAALDTYNDKWHGTLEDVVQYYYVPPTGDLNVAGSWQQGPADHPACKEAVRGSNEVSKIVVILKGADSPMRREIEVVKSSV